MAADNAEHTLRRVFNPQIIGSPEELFPKPNWESEEIAGMLLRSGGIVTDEIVRYVATGLFLFNPPGLRMMLPHVLCYAARHPGSDVAHCVVERLSALFDAEEEDMLMAFLPRELLAIADFLGWLANTGEAYTLLREKIDLTQFYLTALAAQKA